MSDGNYSGKNNSFWGRTHSNESKKKMSLAHKGCTPWNKGLSKSTDKRVARYAKTQSKKYRGIRRSPRTEIKKGQRLSPATEFKRGNVPFFKGKKMSSVMRRKLSVAHIGVQAKEKHPNWKGGRSYEPYSPSFDKDIKITIREVDGFTCQERGISEDMCNVDLTVHHIDYNKNNSSVYNLISLCQKCHGKSGFSREYWQERLSSVALQRCIGKLA